jgi:hypothetical protein
MAVQLHHLLGAKQSAKVAHKGEEGSALGPQRLERDRDSSLTNDVQMIDGFDVHTGFNG